MKKVLVIGGSGMVASRFVELAKGKLEITSVDEKILDITNNLVVQKYFDEFKFDSVINFAAYTNVDGAEKQRGDENGLVWRLNVEGPKNLSEVCKKYNTHFVQISTDFVFNTDGPFSEDAQPSSSLTDSLSWYGWTKASAEYAVSSTQFDCAIVRISYPFMTSDYSLKLDWAKNLIKLYNEQKLYPLFTDQVYSILFIDVLVKPLVKIVNERLNGVFHICSSDTTTPYESGKYLLEKYVGHEVKIQKGSMEEFLKAEGRTPRPRLGGLKTEKTQMILGMKFKTWKQMVDEFFIQQQLHQK